MGFEDIVKLLLVVSGVVFAGFLLRRLGGST